MTAMNYYSIKTLSAARAYINGESEYSKGQKDASADLINYVYLGNESDYVDFKKDINLPLGDHIARIALQVNNNDQEAWKGFSQGKNHPDDIGNMIWLFKNSQHLPMFEKASRIWATADKMVDELHQLGLLAHKKVLSGKISASEKKSLVLLINIISGNLTFQEQAFSNSLGAICRDINSYIFIADMLITLIIVISSLTFAGMMIRTLANSQMKIIEQNGSLQVINAGLDKFVFNVTHDLRSPLCSLIGLIDLVEDETDLEQIKSYTLMMKMSLEKQDQFISEMLAFLRSKHLGLIKEDCSLTSIIDNVITQNHYTNSGTKIHYYKDIGIDHISSDVLKLRVVLNNLVSNSVKYSDSKKDKQWIKVKTYLTKTDAVIEVEDNGLGIRQNDQGRIFDEFYMSGNNKKSSGIGLYLVKDAVTQMNGRIEVKSEQGLYSKFTVSIPC